MRYLKQVSHEMRGGIDLLASAPCQEADGSEAAEENTGRFRDGDGVDLDSADLKSSK